MTDKKTETLEFSVPAGVAARLRHGAKRRGVDVSDLVREMILPNAHTSPDFESVAIAAFAKLADAGAQHVTVFIFDFGDTAGHVAWRTDLGPRVIETIRRWVKRITGELPLLVASVAPVTESQLRGYADLIKSVLPKNVGFALFVGTGDIVSYVSNGERDAVVEMLRHDLLPHWNEAELRHARVERDAAQVDYDQARDHLGTMLSDEAKEAIRKAEARIPGLVLPPVTSASNLETLLMSWAYLFLPIAAAFSGRIAAIQATKFGDKLGAISHKFRPIDTLLGTLKGEGAQEPEDCSRRLAFARLWLESSFARLEIGHKLAASLCFTDVPEEIEVRAPWSAWSFILPDGLFPEPTDMPEAAVARLWCIGSEPIAGITRNGQMCVSFEEPVGDQDTPYTRSLYRSYLNLVRGACLALSNPDDFKKELHHRPSARSQKNRTGGAPNLEQAKFMLSAPVKVDLREHLREMLSGAHRGGHIKAQFLVRGHWRQQAHGPKHSLRKTLWIEPFWKGDPEARVLLRQHKVEE